MLNSEQDIQIEKLLEEKNQEIEKSLKSLEKEKSLRSYHKSVNISFDQMFEYIDKFSKDDVNKTRIPGELDILVSTYKEMAQLYYAQFELLLLNEIEKQRDTQNAVNLSFDEIDKKLGGETNDVKEAFKTSKELLKMSGESAGEKYDDLVKEYPRLMQNAIDKLRNEWQRINTIVSTGQVLEQDEKLIRSLKSVVAVAAHSVGIEAERIVIVPGNTFALSFFIYLENFAVLTIPIYSMQAFWEWSIIWHELAGYKVRSLERGKAIDTVKEKLEDLYAYYKIAGKAKKEKLIVGVAPNIPFIHGYLTQLFSKGDEELILDDLGGFEYQFEQMVAKLPISKYEELRAQGWSVDWFKELFEDAWSVLAIGEPFLDIFEDILSRNANIDKRHPPLEVRLDVAKELLELMGNEDGVRKRPRKINAIAAKKILEFITLLMAAAREIKELEGDNLATQQRLRQESQKIRDDISNILRDKFQKSIRIWKEILDTDNPVSNARLKVTEFINEFSDEFTTSIRDLDKKEEEQINKNYKDILESKDYRELLNKPFFEVDYGTATVTDVIYNLQKKFDEAKLMSLPIDVVLGAVSYMDGSIKRNTSLDDWNAAAALGYTIQP